MREQVSKQDIKHSLYLKAKALGIISQDFNEGAFRQRFFYLFIERNHNHKGKKFGENLFEEKYAQAMLIAFKMVFDKLQTGQKLDLETIKQLHNLATDGVISQDQARYRDSGTSAGFAPPQTSEKFLEKLHQIIIKPCLIYFQNTLLVNIYLP